MFRLRLEGRNRLRETDNADGVRIFFRFLDLTSNASRARHSEGWSFRTLRRLELEDRQIAELTDFGVPEQFATLPPSKQTQLEEKLLGFRDFVLFCEEFGRFLKEVADYPLLQSAMWHYELFNVHEDRLRVLLSFVNRALSKWPAGSDLVFPRARGSFLRLAEDGKYSGPVVQAYSALTRETIEHQIRELNKVSESGIIDLADAPAALKGTIAKLLGRMSSPRNRAEMQSLINALVTTQEIEEQYDYDDLISALGEQWNEWLLRSPAGHSTELGVADWIAQLRHGKSKPNE